MIRACVLGWPVEHSRSPLIHNYWIGRYRLSGSYTKEAVPPEEAAEFIKSLAARGYAGCNVTVPYKELAFGLADWCDTAATTAGAANTLWLERGRLCAANTDASGFLAHLNHVAPRWRRRDAPISVLGAGGAARSIICAFLDAGIGEIRVFNRTKARAERLWSHFAGRVRVFDWSAREEKSRESGLLINTTAVGLGGEGASPFDVSVLRRDAIVCDIVYVPVETPLLKAARARGLTVVDGLGMLLYQAVPGFEKWFGVRPEVTPELRSLLAADIERGACSSSA